MHELEKKLRTVRYLRYEGVGRGDKPEPRENSLIAFIYDIPYFSACGVFPPFHLLNPYFRHGGSTGGMSPGATWEPFELSQTEYDDLVQAVQSVPVESFRDRARYADLPFTFDPGFDGPPETWPAHAERKPWHRHLPADMREYRDWLGAVCVKHRERWHAELKRAGFMV